MALGVFWSLICLVIFLFALIVDKMGLFSRKNHFPVQGLTVLITGGSQGMGRSVGRMLAEKGANVIIVARNVDKLKEAIAYISAGASNPQLQRFRYISADCSSASESSRVIAEATAFNNASPPDIVWCCAGASHPTLFIDTPIEKLSEMMDSNYFSAAYMAHAVLRAWLPLSPKHLSVAATTSSRRARHLIFTSSFIALFPISGYAPYSPSKCALRSLSDSLSMELQLYRSTHTPISVHTVFPATIFTAAYEFENSIKSDLTKKLEEDDKGQSADEAARSSIARLERGDELVATTFLTRLVMCGVLGGSKRNGWAVLDTLLSWVMSLVMPLVRWDMDSKTRKWGQIHGPSGMKT